MSPDQELHKSVVALVFSLYFFYGFNHWKSERATDFYQLWLVGPAIHKMNLLNVYDIQESARIRREFLKSSVNYYSSRHLVSAHKDRKKNILNNTPLLYAVIYLFSSGDYDRDYDRFRMVSLFVYMISLYALCHLLGLDIFLSFVFLIVFTQMFWPFKRDVNLGNVTQIQFGLMTLFIWIQKKFSQKYKNFFGGFLLVFSLLFKPTIMYSVLLLGLKQLKDRGLNQPMTMCMGGILSLLISVIMPYFALGPACTWKNWFASVGHLSFAEAWINDSLIAILFNTLNIKINWAAGLILVSIVFIVLGARQFPGLKFSWAFLRKNTPHGFVEDLLLYGAGICIYFLSAPLVHGQYLMLFVPILLHTFSFKGHLKWPEKTLPFVGLTALFIILTHPVGTWHFSRSLNNQLWNYAAVALIFLCCVYEIHVLSRPSLNQVTK